MKASFLAFSLLSALVSGLVTPEIVPRQAQIYRSSLAVNNGQGSSNSTSGRAGTGKVLRVGGRNDISTCLEFTLPALPGKTCTLAFSNPTQLSGSRRMQIFDIGVDGTTFRNNYRCAMVVKPAGQGIATVQDDVSCTFKCPSSAVKLLFETVPAGDNVEITWDIATAGLTIQAS